MVDASDIAGLKTAVVASGLSVGERVRTAWASASTFRATDFRGGANVARIRLAPQNEWDVNQPAELAVVLEKLEGIKRQFNQARTDGKKVSLADLIVLAGAAAIEDAARKAGHDIEVPFTPGRMDASQAQTDVDSFAALEPTVDGFRNHFGDRQPGISGTDDGRQGRQVIPDHPGDDRARRRHAGAGRQRRRHCARCSLPNAPAP